MSSKLKLINHMISFDNVVGQGKCKWSCYGCHLICKDPVLGRQTSCRTISTRLRGDLLIKWIQRNDLVSKFVK